MSVPVRVEAGVGTDERYDVLASLLGLADRDHAVGKMIRVWRQCTDREVYVLPDAVLVAIFGAGGPEALIAADLAERADAGVRIKGTEGRIEWIRSRRTAAKAGGEANRERIRKAQEARGSHVASHRASRVASQTRAKREPSVSGSVSVSGYVDNSDPQSCAVSTAPASTGELFGDQAQTRKPPKARGKASKPPPVPGLTDVKALYFELYEKQSGSNPLWDGKQAGMVSPIIRQVGAVEVCKRMRVLYSGQGPAFLSPPHDIATVVQHFDKLAQPTKRNTGNGSTGSALPSNNHGVGLVDPRDIPIGGS